MIPDTLKEDFKKWVKIREICTYKAQYCLLLGTPCCYVHCLLRTSEVFNVATNIPCPVCNQNIKYPLTTKCVKCGFDFKQEVSVVMGGDQS